MEDKLRIANKVNTKYKELMNEMDENIKQAMNGNDINLEYVLFGSLLYMYSENVQMCVTGW